jgi:DNA-binding beta-propeller fold protein YncE
MKICGFAKPVRATALILILAASAPARAELAVSANDAKVTLDNGQVKVVPNPPPDTVTIIDLGKSPPQKLAEIQVPASVVGPPLSVAVAPDESIALVTASSRVDPKDPTKQTGDNKLSVIDLKSAPPRVIATLEAGDGASGVSINRAGTLALVANRNEGTVSVFKIEGKTVAPAGKVKVGDEKSGPSHVAIAPDGRSALVTRDGDHGITVLKIEGNQVEATARTFHAGLRPYAVDISADGRVAVVGNVGRGQGDSDTVSVIDMVASPPRTVETVTVGQTPECVKLSPDGKMLAVVIHNGTNRPTNSPFYNSNGKLLLFSVKGTSLTKLAEAPIGHWSQGIAFSSDSKTLLVQNMIEKDIQVFRIEDGKLRDTGQRIALPGGGAGLRTAEK